MSTMSTVTIPKSKFEMLERRASLYEIILRQLPEYRWGIEKYTQKRIQDFMKQDLLDQKTRARLKKIMN